MQDPVRKGKGESGDAPVEPPDFEHLSTQLSALLADMVRTQEVAVGDTWSPEVCAGGAIGRFKLIRELGRGGFGVVYEALDGDLGRPVALKVVKPGTRIAARGREWLQREAEAVARLNHPNIVTLHDFGQGPTGPYLVFELLRGRSLAEGLRDGRLPLDAVIRVGIAVSRALVHAHDAGVVHRDLTPSNVSLGEDGDVKVLDFGLAHLFGRDGVTDGGTPAYMAPEQWEGDRGDARTDLFALGVILHQALSGAPPYQVDKGWSEALEPGETPELPRGAAPGVLRQLVRRMLEREPEDRPAAAREVRDTLLALRRSRASRGRRWAAYGAAVLGVVAFAVSGWLYLDQEPPAGEQVRVVLGAMENGAAEPTLDAVPGLLAAALEPSRRVKLVSPARLALVSREAGLGEPGRLDAERGRNLARLAGAPVVLVPSSWQEDGTVQVAVRAIESETGRALFTAKEPLVRPQALAAVVDSLSDRVRRELNERAVDRKIRWPVAETVTSVPEAARYYYEGVDCVERMRERTGLADACAAPFEQALARDPSFALANYQLAMIRSPQGDPAEQARPHLAAALRAVDRLPRREASLVKALAARDEGRGDEALKIYDAVLALAPDDVDTLAAAASLQVSRHRWAGALQYLEKLVAVSPDQESTVLDLVEVLGRLERRDALRDVLRRYSSAPITTFHAEILANAHWWLGEPDRALEVARRAVSEQGSDALSLLRLALTAAGDHREAEAVARREVAGAPDDPWPRLQVARALAGQGRFREAVNIVDAVGRSTPRRDAMTRYLERAMIAAGSAETSQVWQSARLAAAIDPVYASGLSVLLAFVGDVPHAQQVAQAMPEKSEAAKQCAAMLLWRSGQTGEAMARLSSAEAEDAWPVEGIAPAYLLAEVAAASGEHREALAAVSRFRRIPPRGYWYPWASVRAMYLAARAHQALGDVAEARHEIDRALAQWVDADRDHPLLREMRALHAKM